MNYKFPVIQHINDVLPAIEGFPEFIVAEREGFIVVNYLVNMPETFTMNGPNDLLGALRREARGIMFSSETGNLISRPYHKFFNVNEREEVHMTQLDFSAKHEILEKRDGSFIRPLVIDGVLHLSTKMGITEIAQAARKILTLEQEIWLTQMFNEGFTPIFEYTAPTNQIVVKYPDEKLVLTAIRVNLTGEYVPLNQTVTPFEIVASFGSMDRDIEEYLETARAEVGHEGYVIRWNSGHMIKVKNDRYVRIHKTKDMIRSDRNIAELILNQELDDVLGLLDGDDHIRVKEYEKTFWDAFEYTLGRIEGLVQIAKTVYEGNKKRVALELIPNLLQKQDGKFIFSILDGKNPREQLLAYAQSQLGSVAKYNEMFTWMSGMEVKLERVE